MKPVNLTKMGDFELHAYLERMEGDFRFYNAKNLPSHDGVKAMKAHAAAAAARAEQERRKG
ncbi:MAG: hypothetical protein WCY93_12135 [Anaerolineaceae bacterium]